MKEYSEDKVSVEHDDVRERHSKDNKFYYIYKHYSNGKPVTGMIRFYDHIEYVRNGLIHREDGPAIIHNDGKISYYLDDNNYTKEGWRKELEKRGLITPDYFKNML